jgi:hypothetical protein
MEEDDKTERRNFTGVFEINAEINYNPVAYAYYDLDLKQDGIKITGSLFFPKQTIWHTDYNGRVEGHAATPDSNEATFIITFSPGESQSRIQIKSDDNFQSFTGTHLSLTDNSSGSYFGKRKM